MSSAKPDATKAPTVTTIDLLRHGACDGGQIFRGTTDSPLSNMGWRQMENAIKQLPEFNASQIISSPLSRCRNFAEKLGDQNKIPVDIERAFGEIHFGDWEGALTDDIFKQFPHAVEAFWSDPLENPPPNGETMEQFKERVIEGWKTLTSKNKGKHSLVITHGGVIRMILANLLQMPMRPLSYLAVPHACISRISIYHSEGHPDWPQLSWHRPLPEHL